MQTINSFTLNNPIEEGANDLVSCEVVSNCDVSVLIKILCNIVTNACSSWFYLFM